MYNIRMYIWNQPDWTKFTWQDLSEILSTARLQQGRLIGRMEALSDTAQQDVSLQNLTNEVVKSSEIEGITLPPEQVRASLARHLGVDASGVPAADHYVEGAVEMILDAIQNCNGPLTEDRLFGWHAALFPSGRSGLRQINVGGWRRPESDPMQIVSGPIGEERVHFEAPSGKVVAKEMNAFLEWFNSDAPIDGILKVGIAHLWFVTVHPFDDGNGRIARAISDMAFARTEPSNVPRAYSMSAQIRQERKDYYSQLERATTGKMDITPWLEWFTGSFHRALMAGHNALDHVAHKAAVWKKLRETEMNERQQKMINRLLDGFEGNLTTSKWAAITKCSQDTAARDIQALLTAGVLEQSRAGGRSTHYTMAASLSRADEM